MTRRSAPIRRTAACLLLAIAVAVAGGCGRDEPQVAPPAPGPIATTPVAKPAAGKPQLPPLFADIERRTFQFFWDTTNQKNGLTPDRFPARPFSSIAAVGFALTAYPIGVENGWISLRQARERTLATLEFFRDAPMGPGREGFAGYHGFYYHFLDMDRGTRYGGWVELSSIDTTLLMAGVLFAQSYYDSDDPEDRKIRAIADQLYRRVDWNWMQPRPPLVAMGWHPESDFIDADWRGYNEAMILYVLALGSPTHAVDPDAWTVWTRTYNDSWGVYEGQEYLSFAPQFGHQYSHVWIDFRGIRDGYMRDRGIDYFENSRRATYAQRQYAIDNPMGWRGYGEDVWGLTASDGPQQTEQEYKGELRNFRQYSARGAGLRDAFDDGTLAPTAAVASLPFAPEIVIPATQEMYDEYGEYIYSSYGFLDAFNPSFTYDVPLKTGRLVPGKGWVAGDYLGIDQGPILAMIANYRDGFVWKVMRRNPYVRKGLERAGFSGGWLDAPAGDDGPGSARHQAALEERTSRADAPRAKQAPAADRP